MTWSPQALDELKSLVDAGLSAGQIAERIGISRSAVVGRIHRAKGALGKLQGKVGFQRAKSETVAKPPKVARKTMAPPPLGPDHLLFVSPPCQLFAVPPRPQRSRDIIVVPMPFARAISEARCLFYACDDYAPASADMLVCGCKRAANLRNKPYCADHLFAETEKAAA
jgi:hypothetical protein